MDILHFGFILISILGIGASVTGERLRELGLLDLEELKLRGVFFSACNYQWCSEMEEKLLGGNCSGNVEERRVRGRVRSCEM